MADDDGSGAADDRTYKIIVIQIALPAIVTLLISEFMRKKKWIQYGDMKLEL